MEHRLSFLSLAAVSAYGLFKDLPAWIAENQNPIYIPNPNIISIFFEDATSTATTRYLTNATFLFGGAFIFELTTTVSCRGPLLKRLALAVGPMVAQFGLGLCAYVPLTLYLVADPSASKPKLTHATVDAVSSVSLSAYAFLVLFFEKFRNESTGEINRYYLWFFLIAPVVPPLFLLRAKQYVPSKSSSFAKIIAPLFYACVCTFVHFRDLERISTARMLSNTEEQRFDLFGETLLWDFDGAIFAASRTNKATLGEAFSSTAPSKFLAVEALSLAVCAVLRIALEVSGAVVTADVHVERVSLFALGTACAYLAIGRPGLIGPVAPYALYVAGKEFLSDYSKLKAY